MEPIFEYLQPFDGPVIEGRQAEEVVFAKDQPQYNPLRCLISSDSTQNVMSRWHLTEDQRKSIYHEGADIYLTLTTFGGPLQPIRIAIG